MMQQQNNGPTIIEQDNEPTIIERSKVWLVSTLRRGRAGAAWLWQQAKRMKPERSSAAKPKAQPQKRREQRTWIDQAIDGAFLLVTSLVFLVFLMASLPHVAYFVVTFEPQNPDGSISDWWWMVAYLIAGAINITEFLLSVKFARDLRNTTRGLPWYQKVIPTLATALKYWPFIILISGFSWAANLEHAEQFHSTMLYTAESVKVIVPFFQNKTWGDLNPYTTVALVNRAIFPGIFPRVFSGKLLRILSWNLPWTFPRNLPQIGKPSCSSRTDVTREIHQTCSVV